MLSALRFRFAVFDEPLGIHQSSALVLPAAQSLKLEEMAVSSPLVVVGSVNADIYVEVERLPVEGETIAARSGQTLPGGKGANQAACAARLSYPTFFCGQVGLDGHANLVKDALASAGVRLDHVNTVDSPTGHAVVMLQPGGKNSIIIVGGANVAWPKLEDGISRLTANAQQLIKRAGAVLLQREIPDAVNLEAAKVAKSAGVPVIMDAGGAEGPIPEELLKHVTVLSPNESELARLTAMPTNSLEKILLAAAKVQEMGVQQVLVKMGETGSVLVSGKEPPIYQPAILAPTVVDTTGAGDTFTASYAVALIERQTPAEALRFAAAAASICVRSKGAMPSMPERKAVLQLLKEHPLTEEKLSPPDEKVSRFLQCRHRDGAAATKIETPNRVDSKPNGFQGQASPNQHMPKVMEGLKIGIVGFGTFGQFLAERICGQGHEVVALSRSDYRDVARRLGVSFHRDVNAFCDEHPDIVIMSASIISTETVLRSLPVERLKPDTLFVDVLSVKGFPKQLFLTILPPQFDVLCTHPMFGPNSGRASWAGLPVVYERVRIGEGARMDRCNRFLDIFSSQGCKMVEMSCGEHDVHAAGSQFITHTVCRILGKMKLESTPMNTKGYEDILRLAETGEADSFDLYYGLFVHNPNAVQELQRLETAVACLKKELFGHIQHTSGEQAFSVAKRVAEVSMC
ncbi:uncharacterized protein [Physcomitrium patens]|uniref:Ribokinase n=2 Tax=Physcomitrium patens TaxID=3218 RepID=A0A7I4FQ73_PHYPA|nr:uncharacterized protein LOC112282766 isoform X2 [Physcomitrium patens]|eukprot:XP_024376594.1 uncharacterized protein LOC112282766 isoform X2 [Physcomitrella patens]